MQPDTEELENLTWFNNVGESSSDKKNILKVTKSLANMTDDELYCKYILVNQKQLLSKLFHC